ncbi:hypothetical protein R3W88_019441 [Solanum pinnatisectum]|uniref:Aspartic peptidase DDI1-type domain-containing protein n=1 Tax=Solanum pinnatisectum TaxID=50273 RepID=A0AAV9KJR1_9SOLN|nr:hypothetical protein R3W88_019441 [Solanum pinnatisectum]
MVQLLHSNGKFTGLPHKDPQIHLRNIIDVTDTYIPTGVSSNYVRLTLFPYSLLGAARHRLDSEPPNSITTCDYLAKKFLSGLPGDIEPILKQLHVVSTRSGLQLEELTPKKRDTEAGTIEKKVEEVVKSSNVEVPVPQKKLPPPFPQRLKKKNEDECFGKFLSLLKRVHINLPLVDILQGIPKYAKYMKDIVASKWRLTEYKTVAPTKECSSRIQNTLPKNLKDPGNFIVQISIGQNVHARGLCDLGASITLMPLSLYQKLGLGSPK